MQENVREEEKRMDDIALAKKNLLNDIRYEMSHRISALAVNIIDEFEEKRMEEYRIDRQSLKEKKLRAIGR